MIENVTLEGTRHILSIKDTGISFTCRECAEGTVHSIDFIEPNRGYPSWYPHNLTSCTITFEVSSEQQK